MRPFVKQYGLAPSAKIRPSYSVNAVIYQRAKTGAVAPSVQHFFAREGGRPWATLISQQSFLHKIDVENTQNKPESQYPKVFRRQRQYQG